MPSKRYPLVRGGPPRLDVSWAADYSTLRLSFDGRPMGEVAGRASLEAGEGFEAPDGSQIQVRLESGFPFNAVHVELDGEPLPGSPGDPDHRVRRAAITVFVVAGLTLLAGAMMMLFGASSQGLLALIAGAVLAVLGELTRRGSAKALALAIGFYGADALRALVQLEFISVLVHGLLLAALARALPLLLRRGATASAGVSGTGLDALGPVPEPAPIAHPQTPALTIVRGDGAGARFHLQSGRPLTMGVRGDVPMRGLESMRPRFTLAIDGLRLQLAARGATVNGSAFAGGLLKDGDQLVLGPGCELAISLPGGVVAPAAAAPIPPAPAAVTAPRAIASHTVAAPRPAVRAAATTSPRGPTAPRAGQATPRARQDPRRKRLALVAVAAPLLAVGSWAGYRLLSRPPVLADVSPATGFAADEIELQGQFRSSTAELTVRFGTAAGVITGGDATRLRVRVPVLEQKARGHVAVSVESRHGRSESRSFDYKVRPRWQAIEPPVAQPGQTVALVGEGLDAGAVRVTVAGAQVAPSTVAPGRLTLTLPDSLSSPERVPMSVTLAVAGFDLGKRDLYLGSLPFVLDFEPRTGGVGLPVRLQGLGFEPDATRVFVGGRPALLSKVTAGAVEFDVPAVRSGAWPVEVEVRGVRSSGALTFSVEPSSGASFVLRFLAVPALDRADVLDVATEFSPVLRLAGGGKTGLAARAKETAATLNRLVSAALSGAETPFEVRETPDGPAVAVVGGGGVVTALPEDAAAYAPELAPLALAEHWQALLADHFTLFLQRDRPSRLALRSAKGKAMVDLHAALGLRRPGAEILPGAPDRVPLPLSARLEELALQWTAPTTQVPAESFAGTWQGRLQEHAGPSREATLVLRVRGKALEGTLQFEESGGSQTQKLREPRLDKDELTFVARMAGDDHRFRLRLSSSSLKGHAQVADDPRSPRHTIELTVQM